MVKLLDLQLCHAIFSSSLILIGILLCCFNIFCTVWIIYRFCVYVKTGKDSRVQVSRKIVSLCIVTIILFLLSSFGQFFMMVGFQDCDLREKAEENGYFGSSKYFRIGAILVSISYVPGFIALYSLFSLKLGIIFENTITPVSKFTLSILKIIRRSQIICVVISGLSFPFRSWLGLSFLSLAIVRL